MTKQDFIQNKPFVVKSFPGFDWVYTEHIFGGELRISSGHPTQIVELEELTPDYFVVECWLNRHTDGKIFFRDCELK